MADLRRYLSLMMHEFERKIAEARTAEILKASRARYTDPPFRSQQVNELIDGVEQVPQRIKRSSPARKPNDCS